MNSLPVLDPAHEVQAARDSVFVDGQKAALPARFTYYLLNKPRGFVCSTNPQGHRRVYELLPARPRVFSAGRLDVDSEGLLLLTNDGELVNRLAHPRHGIARTYYVEAAGELTEGALERLRRGVRLAEGKARGEFRIIKRRPRWCSLEVTIRQGLHRQVRRMLAKVGLKVRRLVRTRIGHLALGTLPTGRWRRLPYTEIQRLKGAVQER